MGYSGEHIQGTDGYSREKTNSNLGHDDQTQACGAARYFNTKMFSCCMICLHICRVFSGNSRFPYLKLTYNLVFLENDGGFYSFH